MKHLTRYALLMLMAGALFATSCKKDDDTPTPQPTEELTPKYNNPGQTVDANIALAWHRCLDESDTSLAYLPVADKEEAFATFLAWLGNLYNKDVKLDANGNYAYPCNDTNLQPLGNLSFSYHSSDSRAVAEITLPQGCRFHKAFFIPSANWPANDEYPGFSDLGIVVNNQRVLFHFSATEIPLSAYVLETPAGDNLYSYSLKPPVYGSLPTPEELEMLVSQCQKKFETNISMKDDRTVHEYTYKELKEIQHQPIPNYRLTKYVKYEYYITYLSYSCTFSGAGQQMNVPVLRNEIRSCICSGDTKQLGMFSDEEDKTTTFYNYYLSATGTNSLSQFSFPLIPPAQITNDPEWGSTFEYHPFTLDEAIERLPNLEDAIFNHLTVIRIPQN